MPASDWLAPEVIQGLETEFGTLDDALQVVFARPGVGDELYALGVRDVSGFGPTEFLMPPESEWTVWRRVEAELLGAPEKAVASSSTTRPRGRPEGPVPTSEETFFSILRLVVEEDASAREIDRVTSRARELSFVNRNKAGRLRKWVENNPAAAHHALDRHEIPRIFRATDGGVIFPKP